MADTPAHTPPADRPPLERRAHSPCIGVCRMDAAGELCTGCLRTLDEIAEWSTATEQRRWTILHAVDARRAAQGEP